MGQYQPDKDEGLLLAARLSTGPSPWDLPGCLNGPPIKLGTQSSRTYHKIVDRWVEECLSLGYVVDTKQRILRRHGTPTIRSIHTGAA